ncbi:hypothetical protein Cgig2_007945 [Carnegiea gigantea]|uniref:RING-type domain-containing protein n=1 Tax=Carnegiea gigantea TaxID=171969 RepID=A0A9Q1QH93_9CARY|nr:hypothetical protein Cgig2_007945 [Carnegiea gigantea]
MMINGCMIHMCSYNDPITRLVQFPFWIRNQEEPLPNYCGYPGFDLFCDGANRLSIHLPNSGVFFVQAIDYVKQELLLNDPNNCLPERLLSHNHSISGNCSPFVPMQEQVYWLYNCSNDYLKSLKKIECLSGSNYAVIANVVEVTSNNSNSKCEKLGSIRVPGESGPEMMDYYLDLSSDIRLTWVGPECGECFQKGGQCGFDSNSSLEVGCFNAPRSGLAKNAIVAIALAFAAPLAFSAFCITYFMVRAKCDRQRTRRGDTSSIGITLPVAPTPAVAPLPQTQAVPSGLDRSTIESYPKVVLGESQRLPKPDDKSCPICLGEYLPKEALRTLPHCGHSFHVDCIDEWLTMNASCPVCRNSPIHHVT